MPEIVGVKFKRLGKIYYFSPDSLEFSLGEKVIVSTEKGLECGEICIENRNVDDEKIVKTLKPVVRKLTEADKKISELNIIKEKNAFKICQDKINEHGLEMKLVDVEYNFDGSKIMFFFTSETRIDFRELVKDLASAFRTRIELRQLGVRDEAKMLGGVGICGQELCCCRFLDEFVPVSIKMAKEQGLSLNPTKISGNCGRLMCCLKYEQDVYEELLKITPVEGSVVKTPDGSGIVIDVSILKGIVKVRLDRTPDAVASQYKAEDVTLISRPPRKKKPKNNQPKDLEE